MYMMAKHLHLTAVALSVLLFIARFILLQLQSPLASAKLMRVTPHVAYTLLLVTAGWLCVLVGQYPFTAGWVTAKLAGLIGFVLAGLMATTWAKQKPMQWLGFVVALAVLMFTAHVAYSKSVPGF